MNNITIKIVDFNQHASEVKNIRTKVFIQEQNVPTQLEWDEFDTDATHILAYYDGIAVGTARLLSDGHIGRMSVLKDYRKRNIGEKMLEYLLEIAKEKSNAKIVLSAQNHAVEFYKKYGFIVTSEVYLDAGIPHYDMEYVN